MLAFIAPFALLIIAVTALGAAFGFLYDDPSAVVDLAFDNGWSALRAWREYLSFTQNEVAEKMGISQSAYSQHENSKVLRKSTRVKIAVALGICAEQLDF